MHHIRSTRARPFIVALLTTLAILAAGAITTRSSALPGTVAADIASTTSPPPLKILLVNDDGWNAVGIQTMKGRLEAAGHQVTLVGPATNSSGGSVSFSANFFGQIAVTQQAPGQWSVGGTPADATLVGLRVILKDDQPDLVVSGSNFGQNVGKTVNSSGTVGAATMATQLGKPAIAVSVGVDPNEFGTGFPSTINNMGPAGDLTAKYIKELQATRALFGNKLLPTGTLLNINIPAKPFSQIKGVDFTEMGTTMDVIPNYQPAGPGVYTILPDLRNDPESKSDADITKFRAGYITISLLDGDWTANLADRGITELRLKNVKP